MSEQKSSHIRNVVKTNGDVVPFDPQRLHKWAQFADVYDIGWSDIVLSAYKKCSDNCSTKELHDAMISSCVEMETHDHLRMAGRLLLGSIYKEAHGGFSSIPSLKDFYHSMVERGYWKEMDYTDEEMDILDSTVLDHNRNLNYNYTSLNQMANRYLISDLHAKICHESPQFMFMGIAMANAENAPKNERIRDVMDTYIAMSDLKLNLATPMLTNLRTPKRGLASCNVYTVGDTAESISVGDHIANMMTCASAGIGSHMMIRSKGDPIRDGRVIHQGKLPYYRVTEAIVHASKQACYDDETEVLTGEGFRKFSEIAELSVDDIQIAQVDDNKKITFVNPTAIQSYDYKGDMYEVGLDEGTFLVTPNHEMVYKQTIFKEGEYEEIDVTKYQRQEIQNLTKEVLDNATFDTSVYQDADIMKCGYEHYLAFILCYMGIQKENKFIFTGKTYKIGKVMAEKIAPKLNKYKHKVREDEYEKPSFLKICDIEITDEFVKLTLENDALNLVDQAFYELKDMERTQIFLMIDYINTHIGYNVADTGVVGEGKNDIRTKNIYDLPSVEQALDLQELLVLNNVTTVVLGHHIAIYGQTNFSGSSVEIEVKEGYDGKVYCVTVPTNNIVVRRHGSILVCGNSRGGANTSFYPILDPEIEDLMALKNPMTIAQKRIRNIDYAVQVNKLFVEKVATNGDWYTISYFYAPDLYDAFYSGDYDLFKELYEKYEGHEKSTTYKARTLANKFLVEAVETGRMYVNYIDEMNRHTPFKDTIYSSNLCVAPETKILTKDGDVEINTLKNKEVEVWNGEEWSTVTIVQTGKKQELWKVELSNGTFIDVTPYHKFYIQSDRYYDCDNNVQFIKKDVKIGTVEEVRTNGLLEGSYLEPFVTPNGVIEKSVYVVSVTNFGRKDDTFCAFEPKRNRLFFNGVQTGNCLEIGLPTKPFPNMMDLYTEDSEGEIGLCSLASIVAGRVTEEEYEHIAYLTVKFIDNTIDLMDYPFPSLKGTATKRRSIGVGITNLAHAMASNGLTYDSKEGKEFMHEMAETHMYWLLKASLRLAKERGVAEWMHKSKYSEGWLPIDTYNKNVDKLGDMRLKHDWEGLRKEIVETGGIRNSTLVAFMPNESCLSRDTEIRTVGGTMTLEEIFKLTGKDLDEEWTKLDKFTGGKWFDLETTIHVPTLDGDKEVDKIWVNGNSAYMEIELENGDIIKATHHHKFFIKDENGTESWKMAMELEEGDDIVNVEEV